jgi:hypothetical protein
MKDLLVLPVRSTSMRRGLALAFACLTLSASTMAWAGSAEEEARKAFEQGLALEATQPLEACKSFRKSLEFTRELGPLTKVKECDVREGRLVEGRDKLRELTGRLPPEDPDLSALKTELGQVEARIARIEIALRPGVTVAVRVTLDAKPVTLPSTVEVDPGAHELVVETEGKPVERSALTLGDGEAKKLEVPSEAALREAPPVSVTPAEEGLTGLGIAGLVIGSVGVAGLIGAAITGGMVLSKQSEFEQCRDADAPALCEEVLKEEGDTLLVANGALFIAGGALAAVGATLFIIDLASGPSEEPAPRAALRIGPSSASFQLAF